jgi:uncharacterized protein YecE (DUF72 family)
MASARIGISGWTYKPWRGTFYPPDLPHKRELEYSSRKFNSIEINGSFYSLQRPSSYRSWHEATPADFVFSVKAGRFITHMKKLKGVEGAMANFFASGLLGLNEKLGPILWQLPPILKFEPNRLEAFFEQLPRDTAAAAKLARRHDAWLKGRVLVEADKKRPIRHAMEVRHDSFKDPRFVELLREHDVGLVVADTAGKWPFMEDVTSNFVYVRLHGDEELYVSGYTEEALEMWAGKLRSWMKRGRDVYVYFDNDVKVRAPFDAMSLARKLGVGPAGDDGAVPDLSAVKEPAREHWPAPGAGGRGRKGRATASRRPAASGTRARTPR